VRRGDSDGLRPFSLIGLMIDSSHSDGPERTFVRAHYDHLRLEHYGFRCIRSDRSVSDHRDHQLRSRGRGDGLFILFLSAVIMCCALNGYRRIVAAVGIVAATVMFATVVRLLEALFTMRGSSRACNRQSVRRVGHRLRQHCRTGVGLGIPNRRRVCSGRGRSDGPQEIESIW
jgi:hypothetical protein